VRPWFDEQHEAFRREVQEFLQAHQVSEAFFHRTDPESWKGCEQLYRAAGERGYLSLAWPEAMGGAGMSPAYEMILWDEFAYARAARPPFGVGIVAKAIIAAGTERQQRDLLPRIRSGEVHFALGYSEPEAGSDLTGLRTRAERHGDTYVVTGEKRWTSIGHVADYLWLLCRTGTQESRARGLTVLIVDMRAPGVTVRPIPVMDGERLNEVHLDHVEVPVANRVGEENQGWAVISQSLAVERHVQFPPRRLVRDLDDLVAWARATGLAGDPLVQARLADLSVDVAAVQALSLMLLSAVEAGRPTVVEAAGNKLASTVLCQRLARAALELGGPESLVLGTQAEFLWRQSLCETIGGGTSEILRGVIARHRFGLQGTA